MVELGWDLRDSTLQRSFKVIQGSSKGHSGPFKGHSGPFRGHSGAIQGHSKVIQGHSGVIQGSFTVWETPSSSHFRRSTPDGRCCRGPKGRGSRCEAARAAIRFGGQAREDVLKCTIAPGICPEGGPEVGLISLFFLSVSFPLFPFPLRFPPIAAQPKGAWL